ncbi:MAG: hypothetical protein QGI37_13430, partial [Verrucomicrobiota bacterium]|nr:hypothetical protein [Verrucomicrobiota bacterium]
GWLKSPPSSSIAGPTKAPNGGGPGVGTVPTQRGSPLPRARRAASATAVGGSAGGSTSPAALARRAPRAAAFL